MKRILLIPTTDHTVTCFSALYENIGPEYEIYVILDGEFILKKTVFSRITPLSFFSHQLLHLRKKKGLLGKVFLGLVYRFYVSNSFDYYNDMLNFDAIITSNDNSMLSSLVIKKAQKCGIPTFVQQVASTIINKERNKSVFSRFARLLGGFISGVQSKEFCAHADYLLFMGDYWIKTVNTFEKPCFVVPNAYYYNLSQRTQKDFDSDKQNLVFFSGPFFEISLFNKVDTFKIYKFIDSVFLSLSDKYKIFFKKHPQEFLVDEFKFESAVQFLELTADESLDFCDIALSVSSSMSLQMRILGKLSLGIHPEFCPQGYIDSSSYFFDKTYCSVPPLVDDLLSGVPSLETANSLQQVVELSEDPVKVMDRIFREVLV